MFLLCYYVNSILNDLNLLNVKNNDYRIIPTLSIKSTRRHYLLQPIFIIADYLNLFVQNHIIPLHTLSTDHVS